MGISENNNNNLLWEFKQSLFEIISLVPINLIIIIIYYFQSLYTREITSLEFCLEFGQNASEIIP